MGRRFVVPILIGCSLLVSVAALMGISHLWQRETLTVRDVQGSPSLDCRIFERRRRFPWHRRESFR